jgi:hypothetical protein
MKANCMSTPPNEPGRPDSDSAAWSFTTRAQDAFRQGSKKRLLGAVLVTLIVLAVLILLGPDQQSIQKRFEYYGAPGELRIMPEISIDQGQDRTQQLPQSLRTPPPPARLEIEKEDPDPTGTEPAPLDQVDANLNGEFVADLPAEEAEDAEEHRVELSMPLQSNPDWYILEQVWPVYPLGATESERRIPVIFVKVGIFVGPSGDVLEKMVLATNGSQVYVDEVLAGVAEWKFGWRVNPGVGRWIEMTWNFKSPYFTNPAQQR